MNNSTPTDVLMACGCVGSATHAQAHSGLEANHPSCAIHVGLHWGACKPALPPELAGREARCSCGKLRPSSLNLAFFEYRGPDSPASKKHCAQCGYFEVAHVRAAEGEVRNDHVCLRFKPHGPYEYDSFYCGHGGWD